MTPAPVLDQGATRFLAIFAAVSSGLLALVLLTNHLVDPYLMHQWDSESLQRLRPSREKLSPWGKTYAVAKYRPEVLYVGNSRTELALPADSKFFNGARVFNGALSGGSLGDAIAMLQHASAISKPRVVVWGIDYGSFSMDNGNTDFDRSLVALGTNYESWRFLLDLKRALSFDMTYDSAEVLFGRADQVCRSSLLYRGQKDEACVASNLVDRGGVAKALIVDVKAVSSRNANAHRAITPFGVELSRLCTADTRIMVYINPLHATTLENFYQRGDRAHLEAWKRLLVQATDTARQTGCNIALFDFSGFNSITSEAIPQVSGKLAMENYWEGSHYRTSVGNKILAKMLPLPYIDVPPDFGVQLSTGNIEMHLARVRSEREQYRSKHPQELALLNQWFGPVEPIKSP